MKKNFEYKEPEFKVVCVNAQDVLTASGEDLHLNPTSPDWVMPEFGFGL